MVCLGKVGRTPRPWQKRALANNVLRKVKRHARRATIKLTAPLTVHSLRKGFGQNHADNGTPSYVLQRRGRQLTPK